MEAIATENLHRVYRSHLGKAGARPLKGLSFVVNEHEVFGFLGRNGAGKTTTIKILCSLLKPTRGEARIFGQKARSRAARSHIGYLPENPYFYEYLTPKETLDFYGRLRGLSRAERLREWDMLSDLLDLGDISNQRVRGFSKGMRQRLGFAVALVGDPPLLILDEPMSGLDPLGRRHIRELILRMRDQKKTIFFSSHVLADVEQICNQVGILVNGTLTRKGRIEELIDSPVQRVEVVVTGLAEGVAAELAQRCEDSRESDGARHFIVRDVGDANALLKEALSNGATLVDFAPIRVSLEDVFVSEQESAQ